MLGSVRFVSILFPTLHIKDFMPKQAMRVDNDNTPSRKILTATYMYDFINLLQHIIHMIYRQTNH